MLKQKFGKKGFTLAELLIVIAIIAILVAIMIPVFSAQLNKARAAAELANVRAAYAEEVVNLMMGTGTDLTAQPIEGGEIAVSDLGTALKYNGSSISYDNTANTITVAYGGFSGTFEIDADITITGDNPYEK